MCFLCVVLYCRLARFLTETFMAFARLSGVLEDQATLTHITNVYEDGMKTVHAIFAYLERHWWEQANMTLPIPPSHPILEGNERAQANLKQANQTLRRYGKQPFVLPVWKIGELGRRLWER